MLSVVITFAVNLAGNWLLISTYGAAGEAVRAYYRYKGLFVALESLFYQILKKAQVTLLSTVYASA